MITMLDLTTRDREKNLRKEGKSSRIPDVADDKAVRDTLSGQGAWRDNCGLEARRRRRNEVIPVRGAVFCVTIGQTDDCGL
jgi:hypothetical protein